MPKNSNYTLIKNAHYIVTADDSDTIYENTDILIHDGIIEKIASNLDFDCDVIDGKDSIVYPGLINVHHHLFQTFTRNIPYVQNLELFPWLKKLYEIWRNLDEESIYYSSLTGMAELVKNGCTTVMDHHYVFPKSGSKNFIDCQFRAADAIGVRFYATRGSMSLGVSSGGLPPDDLVEDTSAIISDSQRLIEKYHNTSKFSMHNIGLAPCSPFSVTKDLLIESAALARDMGVRLHTHLCETRDEEAFCLESVGMRPLAYMESCNWIGSDVWYAHGIYFNDEELKLLSETGTGIAHCPSSNMKLASGVCRLPDMLKLNIPVGLAVDGSASNDSSNLLAEIRCAYLLHRLNYGKDAPSGYDILKLATKGSAKLLGRDDIGSLEVGKAADLFMVNIANFDSVGATNSPEDFPATVGICRYPSLVMIQGKIVSANGKLTNIDEKSESEKAIKASLKLMNGI